MGLRVGAGVGVGVRVLHERLVPVLDGVEDRRLALGDIGEIYGDER